MKQYFTTHLHVSWMLAVFCIALVIGVIGAGDVPQGSFSSIAWLLTGVGLFLTGAWRQKAAYIVLIVIGGLLVGLWRGSVTLDSLGPYDIFLGKTVTLKGVVAEDPELNKRGQTVLRVAVTHVNDRKLGGSIWMTTDDKAAIRRSDVVTAKAALSEGFGNFSATAYSAHIAKITRAEPGDVAVRARDWFAGGVQTTISEPQASLGLGYLVGQRRGLPEDLDIALKAAGLTHIVVASGYNLTILVRLARRLFENVSKYLSFVTASSMILGFIAVTGMSPSMSRAGLVAGLGLAAWYYGRRFHPLVLLPFAMAVTVMINPSYAWGDMGWQLSFAAFGGVMILAPLINAYLYGDKKIGTLRQIFIETISAQFCTLPILLVGFGQFSLVAPVANILILPLVPLAMLLTFFAGIAGLIFGSGAAIFGMPAEVILTYMTSTASYMGNLPWAVQLFSVNAFGAMVMFVVIGVACIYMARKTKFSLHSTSLVE